MGVEPSVWGSRERDLIFIWMNYRDREMRKLQGTAHRGEINGDAGDDRMRPT